MRALTPLLLVLGFLTLNGCRTPGAASQLRDAPTESAGVWDIKGFIGAVATTDDPYEVAGILHSMDGGVGFRRLTPDHQLAAAVLLPGLAAGTFAAAHFKDDELTVLTHKPLVFTAQTFSPAGDATETFVAPENQTNVELPLGVVVDGTILAVIPKNDILKVRRLTNVRDAGGRTTGFSMSDEVQWPLIADRGGISEIGNLLSFTTGYPGSLTLIDRETLAAQKGVKINDGWYLNHTVRDGDRLYVAQTIELTGAGIGWVSLADVEATGVPVLSAEAPTVDIRLIENFPDSLGYKPKHARNGSRLVPVDGKLYATVAASTPPVNHLIWIDMATATFGGILPTGDLGPTPSLRGTANGRLVLTLRVNLTDVQVVLVER